MFFLIIFSKYEPTKAHSPWGFPFHPDDDNDDFFAPWGGGVEKTSVFNAYPSDSTF